MVPSYVVDAAQLAMTPRGFVDQFGDQPKRNDLTILAEHETDAEDQLFVFLRVLRVPGVLCASRRSRSSARRARSLSSAIRASRAQRKSAMRSTAALIGGMAGPAAGGRRRRRRRR